MARLAIDDAKTERRRRRWYGFWSVVGIAAIVVLTATFTVLWHVRMGARTSYVLGLVALIAGVAALVGRENHRKG